MALASCNGPLCSPALVGLSTGHTMVKRGSLGPGWERMGKNAGQKQPTRGQETRQTPQSRPIALALFLWTACTASPPARRRRRRRRKRKRKRKRRGRDKLQLQLQQDQESLILPDHSGASISISILLEANVLGNGLQHHQHPAKAVVAQSPRTPNRSPDRGTVLVWLVRLPIHRRSLRFALSLD
jgi:hypothetical protein